jgi:hypothetical protein
MISSGVDPAHFEMVQQVAVNLGVAQCSKEHRHEHLSSSEDNLEMAHGRAAKAGLDNALLSASPRIYAVAEVNPMDSSQS